MPRVQVEEKHKAEFRPRKRPNPRAVLGSNVGSSQSVCACYPIPRLLSSRQARYASTSARQTSGTRRRPLTSRRMPHLRARPFSVPASYSHTNMHITQLRLVNPLRCHCGPRKAARRAARATTRSRSSALIPHRSMTLQQLPLSVCAGSLTMVSANSHPWWSTARGSSSCTMAQKHVIQIYRISRSIYSELEYRSRSSWAFHIIFPPPQPKS
jgi:hypothetical protein